MRKLTLRAYIGAPDGSRVVKVESVEDWEGTLAQSREMANRLAEEALKQGAREILDEARANGYITDRK
jgi:porphobilinogen deaminase